MVALTSLFIFPIYITLPWLQLFSIFLIFIFLLWRTSGIFAYKIPYSLIVYHIKTSKSVAHRQHYNMALVVALHELGIVSCALFIVQLKSACFFPQSSWYFFCKSNGQNWHPLYTTPSYSFNSCISIRVNHRNQNSENHASLLLD